MTHGPYHRILQNAVVEPRGGEPLVTKDKSLYKKHPTAVAGISGGWFVKTHSGTAAKMGYVKRIAKALKLNLKVDKA